MIGSESSKIKQNTLWQNSTSSLISKFPNSLNKSQKSKAIQELHNEVRILSKGFSTILGSNDVHKAHIGEFWGIAKQSPLKHHYAIFERQAINVEETIRDMMRQCTRRERGELWFPSIITSLIMERGITTPVGVFLRVQDLGKPLPRKCTCRHK